MDMDDWTVPCKGLQGKPFCCVVILFDRSISRRLPLPTIDAITAGNRRRRADARSALPHRTRVDPGWSAHPTRPILHAFHTRYPAIPLSPSPRPPLLSSLCGIADFDEDNKMDLLAGRLPHRALSPSHHPRATPPPSNHD